MNETTREDTLQYGHRFYRRFGKRFLDIFLSALALILLSPLLLFLCLLVRIKHGSPILYAPTRPGKDERIFHILKFRSMSNAKNSEGKLLPEKDRITFLGKLLRATSLDEIPELINILRGDMSIVGPRPLIKGYLVAYTPEQRLRHSVRPGLTGLAQVSGRNNLPWDERMAKDLEYVRNLSFGLDCRIVVQTFLKVVRRADVTIPGGMILDLAANNLVKEEGEARKMKAETTWPEIGSHFWKEDMGTGSPAAFDVPLEDQDHVLTFSGRSAIALAVSDILRTRKIRRAYVPSYCCLSMLQALIDLDIPYDFYDVTAQNGEIRYGIDPDRKCDLLLIMKYFGAPAPGYDEIIHKMKSRGVAVIEDISHTLFDEIPGNGEADYHVASLRKWLPMPAGGYLSKTNGQISEKPSIESGHAVLDKIAAMEEKRSYITGNGGDKVSFLKNYSAFEQDLVVLDPMLKIDEVSEEVLSTCDLEAMKERRRRNAQVLYERLSDVPEISFLDGSFDPEKKVPLFVPILMDPEKRDGLRQYLIENAVYCPVHWPEIVGAKPGIRKNELSLICDQRYDEKDMNAAADLILAWCEENRNASRG